MWELWFCDSFSQEFPFLGYLEEYPNKNLPQDTAGLEQLRVNNLRLPDECEDDGASVAGYMLSQSDGLAGVDGEESRRLRL